MVKAGEHVSHLGLPFEILLHRLKMKAYLHNHHPVNLIPRPTLPPVQRSGNEANNLLSALHRLKYLVVPIMQIQTRLEEGEDWTGG